MCTPPAEPAARSRSPEPCGSDSLCLAEASSLPSPLLTLPSPSERCPRVGVRCMALCRRASAFLAAWLGASGTLQGQGREAGGGRGHE